MGRQQEPKYCKINEFKNHGVSVACKYFDNSLLDNAPAPRYAECKKRGEVTEMTNLQIVTEHNEIEKRFNGTTLKGLRCPSPQSSVKLEKLI